MDGYSEVDHYGLARVVLAQKAGRYVNLSRAIPGISEETLEELRRLPSFKAKRGHPEELQCVMYATEILDHAKQIYGERILAMVC